jgi:predicted branched-subunit amino acid permease
MAFIILNMSRLWRTGRPAPSASPAASPGTAGPLRDTLLICLADAIVGAAFGASAVAGGLPWWVPVVMSLIVFAGGSQIAATSVAIAGGGPLAAVAAGTLLNTRLVPYGFAVAGITRGRWWTRLLGAHLTTDESVALALREADPRQAARAFWTCGGLLFVAWNAAVALGVLAGT